MKRIIIYFFMISIIYAENLSPEKVMEYYKIYYKNTNQNEKNILDLEKKDIKKESLNLSMSNNYNTETELSNDFNIEYNDFYIKLEENVDDELDVKLGVSKNINDLVFSDKKHLTKLKEVEIKNYELSYKENLENKLKEILDFYKAIINKYYEITLTEELLKQKEADIKEAKIKLEYGKINELDLKYMELEYKKTEKNYKLYKRDYDLLKKEFMRTLDLEKEYNFDLIKDYEEKEINLKDYSTEYKNLELLKEDLKVKNSKKENFIQSDFDVNYNLENEEVNAGLKFTYKLFNSKLEEKVSKERIKKIKINIETEKKNYITKLEKLKFELINLKEELAIKQEEQEYYQLLLNKNKILFDRGKISAKDYTEAQLDHNNSRILYNKAKNDLNIFKLKNSIK